MILRLENGFDMRQNEMRISNPVISDNTQARSDEMRTPAVKGSQQQQAAGTERTSKWAVPAIVAIGVFMATLDSSIVNISLPTIARYFGVPLSGAVEWVIIAYLVVTAAVLLTAGRLADMIGRKPIWVTGLVIFITGSAICGAAPSLGVLIAARGLQGLGGALIMAISPAMLTTAFPAHERGVPWGSMLSSSRSVSAPAPHWGVSLLQTCRGAGFSMSMFLSASLV